MRIIRFEHNGVIGYGVVQGDAVFGISGSIYSKYSVAGEVCKLEEARLLAPVEPGIVVGIGANYPEAIARMKAAGMGIGAVPSVFFKPASSVIGHLDDIVCPMGYGEVGYAGELAVIMRRRARQISESNALDYVLGYTCANDVVASELFSSEILSGRAKSFHTFCPLGPFIETDLDGDNVRVQSRLNGDISQDDSTQNMVFSVSKIISFISEFMTLEPGNVVITGSSKKMGSMEICAGDIVEVEIEGIGILINTVTNP